MNCPLVLKPGWQNSLPPCLRRGIRYEMFGGGENFKPRLHHSAHERTHMTPHWHLFPTDLFFKAQRNHTNWWPQKPTEEEYGHCFICLFLFFLCLFSPLECVMRGEKKKRALFLFTHFNALSPAFCEKDVNTIYFFYFFLKFDIVRNLFLCFLAKSKKKKVWVELEFEGY